MRVRVQDIIMDAGPAHLSRGDVIFVIHAFAVTGHEMLEGEEIATGEMFSSATVGYPLSLLLQQMENEDRKEDLLEIVNDET